MASTPSISDSSSVSDRKTRAVYPSGMPWPQCNPVSVSSQTLHCNLDLVNRPLSLSVRLSTNLTGARIPISNRDSSLYVNTRRDVVSRSSWQAFSTQHELLFNLLACLDRRTPIRIEKPISAPSLSISCGLIRPSYPSHCGRPRIRYTRGPSGSRACKRL